MEKIRISTKPSILKNDSFQTIQIRVLFPFEETEEDIAKMILLPSMHVYMNEFYPSEGLFQLEKKRRYILNQSCGRLVIGTTGYFIFYLTIPDPKCLGIDHLEKQIEFLSQMIYYPKIVNQDFDSFEVEREKHGLKMGIQSSFQHLKSYQAVKVCEQIDDVGILSRCIENHQDQIDNITPQNLYSYYQKLVKGKTPLVFVMGNIEESEIHPLFEKYLYQEHPKKGFLEIEKNYNYYLKPYKRDVSMIEETSSFKDSSISFVYKVSDMTEQDKIYLSLVRQLLTSLSSSLLKKKLRDEHDLVYHVKALDYPHFGLLEITAFISRDKKEIAQDKIFEVMEQLKDVSLIEPLLENIKDRMRILLIKKLDYKMEIFSDFMISILEIDRTSKENYDLIKQVQAAELCHFTQRLCLDTIYFIEEENHE